MLNPLGLTLLLRPKNLQLMTDSRHQEQIDSLSRTPCTLFVEIVLARIQRKLDLHLLVVTYTE